MRKEKSVAMGMINVFQKNAVQKFSTLAAGISNSIGKGSVVYKTVIKVMISGYLIEGLGQSFKTMMKNVIQFERVERTVITASLWNIRILALERIENQLCFGLHG